MVQAELAYNNLMSQTSGNCTFEVVNQKHLLSPLNLTPLPTKRQSSADAEERVEEIKQLHEEEFEERAKEIKQLQK